MKKKIWMLAAVAGIASACPAGAQTMVRNGGAPVSITRLDCGSILIKDFDTFFSDAHDFASAPRTVTDSCYVVRHADHVLLWDTGLPAALKGQKMDMGPIVGSVKSTVVEQLAVLGLKPSDVDIVGISHQHADHTGQAAAFPSAELVIGAEDYAGLKGKDDPLGPWRGDKAKTRLVKGEDVDIFGDGKVIAIRTPGHTPTHLSLLVRLASGPVLLTGDLYHSSEARAKKAVPPFNTNRADTLASMDRFEKMARNLGARVVIQHEPGDVAKLPAFPAAAK